MSLLDEQKHVNALITSYQSKVKAQLESNARMNQLRPPDDAPLTFRTSHMESMRRAQVELTRLETHLGLLRIRRIEIALGIDT